MTDEFGGICLSKNMRCPYAKEDGHCALNVTEYAKNGKQTVADKIRHMTDEVSIHAPRVGGDSKMTTERQEPCEWCKDTMLTASFDLSGINYCPKCGRKLVKE